jgi:hypothetical protein
MIISPYWIFIGYSPTVTLLNAIVSRSLSIEIRGSRVSTTPPTDTDASESFAASRSGNNSNTTPPTKPQPATLTVPPIYGDLPSPPPHCELCQAPALRKYLLSIIQSIS